MRTWPRLTYLMLQLLFVLFCQLNLKYCHIFNNIINIIENSEKKCFIIYTLFKILWYNGNREPIIVQRINCGYTHTVCYESKRQVILWI